MRNCFSNNSPSNIFAKKKTAPRMTSAKLTANGLRHTCLKLTDHLKYIKVVVKKIIFRGFGKNMGRVAQSV